MKTTFDLPEKLVHRLKMRAAREKKKLKELAAEYLRQGLEQPGASTVPQEPVIALSKVTGLPVIQAGKPAPRATEMTPERIKDILLEQEIEWARESAGY